MITRSHPRCTLCSQPQGQAHAHGCPFARFTFRTCVEDVHA